MPLQQRRRRRENVHSFTFWQVFGRKLLKDRHISQNQLCYQLKYKSGSSFEDILCSRDVDELNAISEELYKCQKTELPRLSYEVLSQLKPVSLTGSVVLNGETVSLSRKEDLEKLLEKVEDYEKEWNKMVVQQQGNLQQ